MLVMYACGVDIHARQYDTVPILTIVVTDSALTPQGIRPIAIPQSPYPARSPSHLADLPRTHEQDPQSESHSRTAHTQRAASSEIRRDYNIRGICIQLHLLPNPIPTCYHSCIFECIFMMTLDRLYTVRSVS